MAKHQGTFMTGYVTIVVTGKLPERFFQACAKAGIPAWDIRKTGTDTCRGRIEKVHIPAIRELRRGYNFKIRFVEKKGLPFLWRGFLRKKEWFAAAVLSLLLIIFLSNILWRVEVSGVPHELEVKIEKQLKKYGIHSGAWLFTLDEPSTIQHKLLQDVPQLLWIGVKKSGTSLELRGVEKTIVAKEETKEPRHLIASKNGVIKKMYVSKGRPMKQVDDYVEKGDLLVSGELGENLEESSDEEDEEKTKKKGTIVAADGDIRARTWYETKVTVPLNATYETLTGNSKKKYYMRFGDFHLPVWGFGSTDYKHTQHDYEENKIRFIKWDMPMQFVTDTLSEKELISRKRTHKEAIAVALEQAKQELQLQLGPEASIVAGKVLHQTIENGKVKLSLYLTAEENIALAEPIKK
ncbi:sporulation protein YqfD [Aciduricibacillus chroicocephali]|uniref:Sporulation protein YqfD n=1 Tax=Aciduricibacillus chroicocephali TaxID=3054939 RepID=A0ABY9KSB8_9BACI|nr:sporulation protein YqfD [Bacillaceae bacterium 44XB]